MEDTSPIAPGLRPVGALAKDTLSLYRARFWTLLGISIAPLLAVALLIIVPILIATPLAFGSLFRDGLFLGGGLLLGAGAIAYSTAAFIVALVAMLWGQLSLVYSIIRETGFKESYARSAKIFLPYLWLCVVLAFILVGFGVFAFVPAIIAGVWFAFAAPVLVVENERGMNALLKSREYVRGRWWSAFGRIFLLGFFFAVLNFALSFLNEIGEGLGDLAGFVLAPIWPIYLYMMYDDFKAARGSFAFAPTRGRKMKYVGVACLGVLIILLLVSASPLISR